MRVEAVGDLNLRKRQSLELHGKVNASAIKLGDINRAAAAAGRALPLFGPLGDRLRALGRHLLSDEMAGGAA